MTSNSSNSANLESRSSYVGSATDSAPQQKVPPAPPGHNPEVLRHQFSYGGPAPTYVNNQYTKYEGGPKGKNLKEGGFEGEGPGDSINAEPGSQMDPGRGAEERFGVTQREDGAHKVTGNQRYGGLDETSA